MFFGFYAGWNINYEETRTVQASFPELNRWYYVVGVFDGSKGYLYINKELKAWKDLPPRDPTTQKIGFGGHSDNPDYRPFAGIIDESRVSTTPRSMDWIKDSFESGRNQLNNFGSEERFTFSLSYNPQQAIKTIIE